MHPLKNRKNDIFLQNPAKLCAFLSCRVPILILFLGTTMPKNNGNTFETTNQRWRQGISTDRTVGLLGFVNAWILHLGVWKNCELTPQLMVIMEKITMKPVDRIGVSPIFRPKYVFQAMVSSRFQLQLAEFQRSETNTGSAIGSVKVLIVAN